MGVFTSGGRVAICATGAIDEKDITSELDVMFIRPVMDFGTRQKVIGSAAKVTPKKADKRKSRAERKKEAATDMAIDVGAYQFALLFHNLIGWQGPSFVNVPLTQGNVERLNPTDPLVAKVLEEIGERNATEDDEDDDDPNVIEMEPTTPTALMSKRSEKN